MDLEIVEFRLVQQSETTATAEAISRGGQLSKIELFNIEGRWIPKEVATTWGLRRNEFLAGIAKMEADPVKTRSRILIATTLLNGLLMPMEAAETQEQFNTAWDRFTAAFSTALSAGWK